MDDHIQPFHFWVQPILPLAYDDSLSYLETLLKVKVKLNEVIDWANNYKDELYQYVDQKTAENLAQMQAQLVAYQNQINGRLNSQDAKINRLEGDINGILTTVNSIISQFQTDINRQIAQFQLETNTQLRQFNDQITNQINQNEAWVKAQIAGQNAYINAQLTIINKAIDDNLIAANEYTDQKIKEALEGLQPGITDIIYPDDYKQMTIQEAINRTFYDLSFWTLTAQEFDNLPLEDTTEELDNLNLTAYDYDIRGRYWLKKYGSNVYQTAPKIIHLQGIEDFGENGTYTFYDYGYYVGNEVYVIKQYDTDPYSILLFICDVISVTNEHDVVISAKTSPIYIQLPGSDGVKTAQMETEGLLNLSVFTDYLENNIFGYYGYMRFVKRSLPITEYFKLDGSLYRYVKTVNREIKITLRKGTSLTTVNGVLSITLMDVPPNPDYPIEMNISLNSGSTEVYNLISFQI